MKHFLNLNKSVFKVNKRLKSVNSILENIHMNREKEDKAKKDVENFLSGNSPLKGFKNEWATTPYPEGTLLEEKEISDRERIDPETTSVILFPGQGNQYVGMGKELMNYPNVKDMFDAANSILKYDLKSLCLEGPTHRLNKTKYCQVATLVCSLAAIEELKEKYPSALRDCIATCGFSIGEITALVFAGCITFEKAVHLTKIRGEAMQICSNAVDSGMMSVLYGPDSDLKSAMTDAKNECTRKGITNPVCQVANYLIPECKVLAGHNTALGYIKNNLEKYKIRKASVLPVSGAFHTTLMKEAAEPFRNALKKIEIRNPLVPVLSNSLGKPYVNAAHILSVLPKQIYKPVKWEQTMQFIYQRPKGYGFPHTYECGPGKSLSVILKRVCAPAAKFSYNVFA